MTNVRLEILKVRIRRRPLIDARALFSETDGVCLDYRDFDGIAVRAHFSFTEAGKICHTACEPMRKAA
jgi:hypothetical protein